MPTIINIDYLNTRLWLRFLHSICVVAKLCWYPISFQITAIQIHVLTVVHANRLVQVLHAYAQTDSRVKIVKTLSDSRVKIVQTLPLNKDDIGLIMHYVWSNALRRLFLKFKYSIFLFQIRNLRQPFFPIFCKKFVMVVIILMLQTIPIINDWLKTL